jgi:NAD(P)-dependent dehydrogenase (short-subunit alcohol dehydrogenase family)
VREHVLRSIPLGRIGDSEKDIGGVVAFLCSDRASYMTGCTISVDGGASWLR